MFTDAVDREGFVSETEFVRIFNISSRSYKGFASCRFPNPKISNSNREIKFEVELN
jgi:hypothetical protein